MIRRSPSWLWLTLTGPHWAGPRGGTGRKLRFVRPPECEGVSWLSLKAGDCIVQHGGQWYSGAIQDVTASPWSHAAMVIEDGNGTLCVAEMTSPRLRITLLTDWVAAEPEIYVCAVAGVLSDQAKLDLWNWWSSRVGESYDYLLLAAQLLPALWQRLAVQLRLPGRYRYLPVLAIGSVCSVAVARAYAAIGLVTDEGDADAVTPADLPRQTFLQPLKRVEI